MRIEQTRNARPGAAATPTGQRTAARHWRAGAALAAMMAVVAPAPLALGQSANACLSPESDGPALSFDLLTSSPAPVCAPTYQIVVLRNLSDAALGDVRLAIEPPLGPERMRFDALPGAPSHRVEVSFDDGDTWRPAPAPLGAGTEDDPFIWSVDEIPGLDRLGPRGAPDDSVLLRWRATLGEAFGDPTARGGRLSLRASARDACGARASSPLRAAPLPAAWPELRARLVGRNATRGGGFSATPRAAPGDEIEWRVTVANDGDADAERVGVALTDGDGVPVGAATLDAAPAGGSSVTLIRARAAPACGVTRVIAAPEWSCAAPAGTPVFGGPASLASAALHTALEPSDLVVSQTLRDRSGAARPGPRAVAEITVANRGAPAFAPRISVRLPDGYALDPDFPPELRSATGAALAVTLDAASPGSAVFVLAPDGTEGDGRAALDPDASVTLRFGLAQARPSDLSRDALATTVSVEDGCGLEITTPPTRLFVTPRRPDLSVSLTPLGDPIVSGQGDRARFRLRLENEGDAPADAPEVALALGPGWRGDAIAGCEALAETAPSLATGPSRRRYLCGIERSLGPGEAVAFDLDLTADLDPFSAPAPISRDALAIEASSRHAGPRPSDVMTGVDARADAIGFAIRHQLLTETGAPRQSARPLDLGERATAVLDARFFAGGPLTDGPIAVTLSQASPQTLRVLEAAPAEAPEGWAAMALAGTLRSATGRDARRTLWRLRNEVGRGAFSVRALLEAVAAPGGAEQTPTPERAGALTASAVFTLDGREYGADAATAPALQAPPLPIVVRYPDLRLGLSIGGTEDQGALERPLRSLERGRPTAARVTLANRGAAPGFVDWITLALPPGFSAPPFEADGLDNDGDGAVDEPDERIEVDRVEAADGALTLRWTPGGAAPGAEDPSRIPGGQTRSWPLALVASDALSPGAAAAALVSARVGPRPLSENGTRARQERRFLAFLAAEALRGFAVATQTPVGLRADTLPHGAAVGHRAVLDLPAGRTDGVALWVSGGPAFATLAPAASALSGAQCEDGAPPVAQSGGQGAPGVLWRLGDCVAPSNGARAILDLSGTLQDAPASVDAAARAAWRRAILSAEARWRASDGGSKRVALGRAALVIAGPAPVLTAPDARLADAALIAEATLRNEGDQPLTAATVTLSESRHIACESLRVSAGDGAAATGCGAVLALSPPLMPGESVALRIDGARAADAPPGADAAAMMTVDTVEGGVRPAVQRVTWPGPPLPAPTLLVGDPDSGALDLSENRPLRPGDRLAVSVIAPPGWDGPADLTLRARLLRPDGQPASPGAVTAALVFRADDAGADSGVVDGWVTAGAAVSGEGARFDGTLTLADAPAVIDGARLEIEAAYGVDAVDTATQTEALAIGEPALTVAGAITGGARPSLDARVCNIGGAPAHGVSLQASPPPGVVLGPAGVSIAALLPGDPAAGGASLTPPSDEALALAKPFGGAEDGGSGSVRLAGEAMGLPPGACALLRTPVATPAPTLGPPGAIILALDGYRGRPSAAAPGRLYPAAAELAIPMPPPSLALQGPSQARPDGSGRIRAPFTVAAPAGAGPLTLTLSAQSETGRGGWRFFEDRDRDGLRDGDEPLWTNGGLLPSGAPLAFIVEGVAPQTGRDVARIRALGAGSDGTALSGALAVALAPTRPGGAGSGDAIGAVAAGVAARRLMAVDRDCDGDRVDESVQDALFEPRKAAAPGECVIMRLEFQNTGGGALEGVAVEDTPPPSADFIARSARFAETPPGLVAIGAEPPTADAPIRFRFAGAFAPGARGAVEYRVRLSGG